MSVPYKVVANIFAFVAKYSIMEEKCHIEYNDELIYLTEAIEHNRNPAFL